MSSRKMKVRCTEIEMNGWEDRLHAGHNDSTSDRTVGRRPTSSTGLSPRSNQRHHPPTGARCSSVAETLAAWRHFARYADESHDEQDLPRWQRPPLDGLWPPERLCGPAVDDLPTSRRTRLAGTQGRKRHPDRVLGGQVRCRPIPAPPPR